MTLERVRHWSIALIAVAAITALVVYQFRGWDASARGPVRTLTIASIAYPWKGKQVFNGLTGTVIEQGWLKAELAKRGVALHFFPVPTAVGGPLINEGFAGKRIDFAAYGDFPALIAVAGGVPLKIVVPVGSGNNSYLVVRNGLKANSIRDLVGKRIALHRGRPWELPFTKLAEANGLSLDDFRIMNINPPASHAALASGDIDAAFLLSDAIRLKQRGAGRIIWSTKEAPQEWKMRAELFGRADFIENQPDLTQLVADAYIRAAHWSSLAENRTQVVEQTARGDTPVSVIEADMAERRLAWPDRFSPLFDDAMVRHYRSVADHAFASGLVRKKVDADSLLAPQFVQRALANQDLRKYWPAGQRTAVAEARP